MKRNAESICDDNGIEVLVAYKYDKTEQVHEEPGNMATCVAPVVYTELEYVEVVIAGIGIDILPMMTEKQKLKVIDNLSHNK